MVSSMIKQESFDSSLNNSSLEVLKSQNSQVPVASSNAYATNAAAAAVKNSNVNHSPKIGSRRIFTPHFKLQVLESYRSDSDCKGNQRATARKYNIHRRQIQKWLQCETNLRSSVANINQTNVKHQFHNITQLQQQQQQQLQMPINTTDSQFNRRHIQHLLHKTDSERLQRSMDTSRQSVLPVSLMETASSASLLSAQAVIATKNLTTGAMSAANKTKKNMASNASASSDAIVAPSMHPLHHHHYPITYAHLSDSALVSVPITNYMPPSHHHLHHHHPYQNQFHHSHSLIPQLASSYQPTASLSETMLSAPRSEASEIAKVQNKVVAEWRNEVQHEESRYINRVCTLKENENHDNYRCRNNPNETIGCREGKYNNDRKIGKIAQQNVSAAPMDLSLGPRREQPPVEVNSSNHKDLAFTSYNGAHSRPIEKDDIVDLTFRKRKYFSNGVSDVPAEKVVKRVDDDGEAAGVDESLKIEVVERRQDNNEDNTEEIEIDVEERTAPSKPIKLFKPYLLDEEDAENEASSCTSTAENNVQRDPIIWSHHPACASPNTDIACQNFSRGSAFQSPSHEMFPTTNSCFHVVESGSRLCNYNTSSPPSSLELPLGGLQCPKGSPVSGYESSSSTYSDSSSGAESRENNCNRAELQLDLKLHPICSEDMILNKSHIQKWLDQGPNKTTPNASIALYI